LPFSDTASKPVRYGIALLSVVAALTLRLALDPVLGRSEEFLVLTLGILAAAHFGGRGPGLLASLVSVILAVFFFVEPRYSLSIANRRDAGSLMVLLVAGVVITLVAGRARGTDAPGRKGRQGMLHAAVFRRSALLGTTFVLLAALTRLLYGDFQAARDRQHLVEHTYQVLTEIQLLIADLEHAESAERGYLITGDANYLSPLESALRAETADRLSLHHLTADNPAQGPRVDTVDRLAEARSSQFREAIRIRQLRGAEAAAEQVSTNKGEQIMDECRAALHTVEEEERGLLAKRSAAAEELARRTRWVLGLGSGSLLLLLVIAAAVIERDIQDRDAARLVLKASEERLRLALGSADAGIWEWDLRTNHNVWSEELWKLYGLAPDSCAATYEAWQQIMHPDDRQRTHQILHQAASTGTELNMEFRVPLGNGGERWLMSRGSPLRDAGGRTTRFVGIAVDITQRRQAEEVLRESEQNLRRFAESAPVAIAMFDRDMLYLAASRRFRDDYHLGSQELVGRSHYEVFPEITARWREIHRQCLAGATERHPGEKFVRENGAEQWIRWEVQPWRQTDGEIGGIVLFSEEISEQKRSEQALIESEARLRLAQQAARVGTFEWNMRTGATTWTPELEAMYGLAPGQFPGNFEFWKTLVHPEDLPEALRRLEQALETGRFEAEWRALQPDGSERRLAARALLFKDDDGQPQRVIGVNIDITELRAAEAAARQWQRAFEQAELAIALSDSAAGTFSIVNETFARQRGYAASELVGHPIAGIFPPAAREGLAHSAATADREGHITFESEHQRKDGSCFPVRVDLTVVRNHSGDPVSRVAFVQDLTAQRRAEQEIRQLNSDLENRVRERTAQLEAANRELEAFSYSVSHDLRAPLRGIDGWSLALAEDYAGQLDERAQQYLERVRSETQRMGLLIDDMLQLSRVSRSTLEFVPVDLSAIAQEIAAGLREENPARDIQFDIQPGLTARGDARFLEIALANLLRNATKFTGPRQSARIEFHLSRHEGTAAFCIRDNGVGFNMAYAGLLFGAFQRLHKASEFPGTGIGLAIVQRVIHRHGGHVWAEARPGEGASFYFTLGAAE
jgi:PAS domain S-box-containing protein